MNYRFFCGNTDQIRSRFLAFPRSLYQGEICTQDISSEKALLRGTHPLSSDFNVLPMVVVGTDDETYARALLTFYEGDDAAYLGFFESVNDLRPCKLLLQGAMDRARDYDKTSVMGPVNASIWIGYRFKTDHFGEYYSGEPLNKDYYADLWKQCGFEVSQRYYTYRLSKITDKEGNPKYEKRVNQFLEKGYEYKNLDMKEFDKTFKEIYELLIERFSTFPGFKNISYEAFYKLFGKLKYVLSPEDVIVIYKDKELVAFSVSTPNLQDCLCGSMTPAKLIRLLKLRRSSKERIYLYMAVKPGHYGLGSVMAELIRRGLYESGHIPVKALIQDNKATGIYYNELTDSKTEYVLMTQKVIMGGL